MPVFTLEESEYAGLIPEDKVFPAEVAAITKMVAFKDRDTGDDVYKIEFKFKIESLDSPWDGLTLKGKTGTKFNTHPDCRLRNWIQEILGTELPAGFSFDTEDLLGTKCRIIIGVNRWKDKNNGEDKESNFVKDVLRSEDSSGESPF